MIIRQPALCGPDGLQRYHLVVGPNRQVLYAGQGRGPFRPGCAGEALRGHRHACPVHSERTANSAVFDVNWKSAMQNREAPAEPAGASLHFRFGTVGWRSYAFNTYGVKKVET